MMNNLSEQQRQEKHPVNLTMNIASNELLNKSDKMLDVDNRATNVDMSHIDDRANNVSANNSPFSKNKINGRRQRSYDNNNTELSIGQSVPIKFHPRFHGYSLNDKSAPPGDNDSDRWERILTILAIVFTVITFPISIFYCVVIVKEYQRIVVFRLGRIISGAARGPGVVIVIPWIDTYKIIDLRTVSINVPEQEILTKDSVTVLVDAVVYYRIVDATVAVTNVADYYWSTQRLAAITLRNVLGTKTLCEILSQRDSISVHMQNALDDATEPWGVKVERVEMKDVSLPQQMQRAMAAEAEAAREARAKIVAAEGEHKASIALKAAAQVIAQSPAALQLRYLQTLHSISAEKNSTIIFPLPMELFSGLQRMTNPTSPSITDNTHPASSAMQAV